MLCFLFFSEMAADSDGGGPAELIETVITCEGNLYDPQFPLRFNQIVCDLRKLLLKGMTL